MSECTEQANEFASKYGIKLTLISEDYKKHFADDKNERQVYKMRISRNGKSYTFDFGASIADPSEPTMYDVLAAFTKYDPRDFENFCGDYGYDEDSRTAEKTYKAVKKEFAAVERLFGDILEELQEIQ